MAAKISRRTFLKNSALCAGGLGLSGIGGNAFSRALGGELHGPFLRNRKLARKALVLGMDGLDPNLVRRFAAEGKMPTFKRLMERGHFGELQTTMPPQSPVAWASFITGCNPGGHGIYDFIHRDPASFAPYLSTSRTFRSRLKINLGKWAIPISSGKVHLMREGAALWEPFEEADIPATIYQLPANFPVIGKGKTKTISGMGTPDLVGGYGISTLFSDTPVEGSEDFTSVRVQIVRAVEQKIHAKIKGPPNEFRKSEEASEIDLTIHFDPREDAIVLEVQGQKVLLQKGDWSEWIPLRFDFIPYFATAAGAVRFLAKEIRPNFKLYMSPIQIDPLEPSLPICNPSDYSAEVANAIGRFHTQGLPADVAALSEGVLTDREFLQQSKTVLSESERAFDYELSRFDEGLLFFYFSSPDQNEHMLWRNMDPSHPHHDPKAGDEIREAISFCYARMDACLARALEKVDASTLLIVMSDHGFAHFTREFHLSTWLVEQGYTAVTDERAYHRSKFYEFVDWPRTQAYALGINGVYLNLKGRERRGALSAADGDRIRKEIIAKLEAARDPLNGNPIVMKAYDSRDIYSGPYAPLAPDILVGYHAGYRVSDEAVLGRFPEGIMGDRNNPWSADHCMDPRVVPGTLLTNWRCLDDSPAIWDITPSILKAIGLDIPAEMTGRPVLEPA